MIYDDTHLTSTPSTAEELETTTTFADDGQPILSLLIRKPNPGRRPLRSRVLYLDDAGARVFRNELNEFIGDAADDYDPSKLVITVGSEDFELRTIEGMLTLLGRHDRDTKARILGYLMERVSASLGVLDMEPSR